MSRDDVIKEFMKIKGVGKVKAELLYDKGYTSIEKLKKAKVEDLTSIKGFTAETAENILKQVSEISAAKKSEKRTSKKSEKKKDEKPVEKEEPKKEKETKDEDVVIVEESKKVYHVKKKPDIPSDKKQMLILRRKIKQRTPCFLRQEWFRYKRIPMKWRRPRGISSKMRMHKKYRPSVVRVGFRGPSITRGLHPSGFEDILVYNTRDLERLDPKTQAARIGSTVGSKKRVEIAKRAEELNIRILNMKV
ncbi:MAG: 50S ribosomal protein L32e [Candidatus Thermoplasmatota archaeon]